MQNNPTTLGDPDGHELQATLDDQAAREAGQDFAKVVNFAHRFVNHPFGKAVMLLLGFGSGGGIKGAIEEATEGAVSKGITEGAVEGGTATSVGNTEGALSQRAQEVQGVLSEETQKRVTTAVGTAKNADGSSSTLVSTSEGTLRPAQRSTLQPGETAVRGKAGVHAEENMLNHAKANNQTLETVAPSRPACQNCQQTMQRNNVRIIPPPKKVR